VSSLVSDGSLKFDLSIKFIEFLLDFLIDFDLYLFQISKYLFLVRIFTSFICAIYSIQSQNYSL
jgi:hypothetical protein